MRRLAVAILFPANLAWNSRLRFRDVPDVDAYWLGGNFSCARTKDGTIRFWGEESAAPGLLGLKGNQRIPVKGAIEKLVPPS